jgi:dsRNA-specific ribonuclease
MKLDPRQRGRASAGTLSLAVCAIIGASYMDSNNIKTARKVAERFGQVPAILELVTPTDCWTGKYWHQP